MKKMHAIYFMKPAFPSPLASTLGLSLSMSEGFVALLPVLEEEVLPCVELLVPLRLFSTSCWRWPVRPPAVAPELLWVN